MIVEWFGTVISAISLYVQLKKENKRDEANSQLIRVLLLLHEKLYDSKNVHKSHQEAFYTRYEVYFRSFRSTSLDDNFEKWVTNYDNYNKQLIQNNVDEFIEKLIEDNKEEFEIDDIFQKFPAAEPILSKLGIDLLFKSFTYKYLKMCKEVLSVKSLSDDYDKRAQKKDFKHSWHDKMSNQFKNVLIFADMSMINLIDIIHAILSSLTNEK